MKRFIAVVMALITLSLPAASNLPISSPATNGWAFGPVKTNSMFQGNHFDYHINSGGPSDSKYWVNRLGGGSWTMQMMSDDLTVSNFVWSIERTGTNSQMLIKNLTTISNNINVWHNGTNSPYTSLAAARTASVAGDTIVLSGGNTYVWTNDVSSFLKAGVDLINDGTLLLLDSGNSANSTGFGIVDDRSSGASTNVISGIGTMRFAQVVRNNGTPSSGTLGLMVVTNASTQIDFRQNELQLSNYNSSLFCAVYVQNCRRVDFNVHHVTDMRARTTVPDPDGAGTLQPNVIGVYWNAGNMYVHMDQYYGTAFAVWAEKLPGAWVSDLWVDGQSFNATGSDVQSPIYIATQDTTESPLWRTWIRVMECIQSGANGQGAAAFYQGTGKHYLRANKLGGVGTSSVVEGLTVGGSGAGTVIEVWADLQKISSRPSAINVGSSGGGSAILNLNVQQLEDLGGRTEARIMVSTGGLLRMNGGATLTTNSIPVSITGSGSAFLQGVTLDSSFGVLSPVSVAGNGLRLKGCTLVAPVGVDSITAAGAQTVSVNGVGATTAKNTNITLSPNGGFTVDSATR